MITLVTPRSPALLSIIKPSAYGESRLLGIQEPITAELPELTWRDCVPPVVLFVTTAAILHVAFSYFIAGPLGLIFFRPWPPVILPAGLGELAIVAVISGLILAVKARDRGYLGIGLTGCRPSWWRYGLLASSSPTQPESSLGQGICGSLSPNGKPSR